MATRADVIALALRRLGVVAADEAPDADAYAYCDRVLVSIYREMEEQVTMPFELSDIANQYLVPLANLLAVEVAQHYAVQAEPRSRAWSRFRATIVDDDRPDLRDLDEDGTVSDAEAQAWGRAAYF